MQKVFDAAGLDDGEGQDFKIKSAYIMTKPDFDMKGEAGKKKSNKKRKNFDGKD